MSTLLYSPGVKVYIDTDKHGVIDVSDDLTSGQLSRRSDGVSTFTFSIQNPRRKYDQVFTPNDRIIVMMKRISWMRVFTGYLNSVPLLTIWPRVVNVTASCSLKRLQYWYWDPALPESQQMVAQAIRSAKGTTDGGVTNAVLTLMDHVVGWPAEKIHIGGIPDNWFEFAYKIAKDVQARAEEADQIAEQFYATLGGGGAIGGVANGGGTVPSGALKAGTYGGVHLNQTQANNAVIIYNVGKQTNATNRDIAVALMAAMQESSLINTKGGDRDSAGLFQMRPSMGWGSYAQVTNPQYASKKFYSVLLKVKNRNNMSMTQEAQAVERSGTPGAYAKWKNMAVEIVNVLAKGSAAATLGSKGDTGANQFNNQIAKTKTGTSTGPALLETALSLVKSHPHIPYQLGGDSPDTSKNPTRLDCCITGDVFVYTVGGPKPIAEIKSGDQVYSWENGSLSTHNVRAMMPQKVQPVFRVRTRNRTVRASGNHPFLRLTRTKGRKNGGNGFLPVDWSTEWCRADELKRGDLLVELDNLPEATSEFVMSDGTRIDEEVAWILGLFLADGHVRKAGNGFEICVYDELRERVRTLVRDLWGLEGHDHPSHGISFGSRAVAQALTDLGMKVPGPEKQVPEAIFRLPAKVQRAFLDGFWEGDGSDGPLLTTGGRGRAYHSSSARMLGELRAMHIALGDSVTNISTNKRAKKIIIKGREVKVAKPLHTFVWYPDARKQGQRLRALGAYNVIKDGRFRIERLLGVEADGEEMTYDIEVEGAHNFIADGMVVHNSSFVQWCYYHTVGKHAPRTSQAQSSWCKSSGKIISAAQGMKTQGALMFRGGVGAAHHVEISVGDGKHTVGSHHTGTYAGVISSSASYWTMAGLPPNLAYNGNIAGLTGDGSGPTDGNASPVFQVGKASQGAAYNPNNEFDKLFGDSSWVITPDTTDYVLSEALGGIRALLNDQPLLPYLKNLFNSTLRSFSSAPNGDLIAWFPDYYGIWGTAAKMVIEPIECLDFNVEWSDDFFVTHQYTTDTLGYNAVDLGSGTVQGINPNPLLAVTTDGIATIDIPAIMYALFGLEADKQKAQDFISYVYKRFGARPDYQQMPGIMGPSGEFFSALFLFMRQWAYQYNADVQITFMPELWPGMLIQLPWVDFQAYVTTVTHSFTFGPDGGFQTTVNIAAPSRLPKNDNDRSGALIGLPIAGGLGPDGK